MDRTSSFPKQDFEGMVYEIWSGLDICLYHAAYVRSYTDSTAMRPYADAITVAGRRPWDENFSLGIGSHRGRGGYSALTV